MAGVQWRGLQQRWPDPLPGLDPLPALAPVALPQAKHARQAAEPWPCFRAPGLCFCWARPPEGAPLLTLHAQALY